MASAFINHLNFSSQCQSRVIQDLCVKFQLTFLPGSRDSPPVVPAISVLHPRLRASAWKAQRGFALTIVVKLVQRSTERGSRRQAAVIFDTTFASGEALRALGCFGRSGSVAREHVG